MHESKSEQIRGDCEFIDRHDGLFPLLDYSYFRIPPPPSKPVKGSNRPRHQLVFFVAGWPDTHSLFANNIVAELLLDDSRNAKKDTPIGAEDEGGATCNPTLRTLVGITLPGFEHASLSSKASEKRMKNAQHIYGNSEPPRNAEREITSQDGKPEVTVDREKVAQPCHTSMREPKDHCDIYSHDHRERDTECAKGRARIFGFSLPDTARMLGKTIRHIVKEHSKMVYAEMERREENDCCASNEHIATETLSLLRRPILVAHDWGSVMAYEMLAQIEDGYCCTYCELVSRRPPANTSLRSDHCVCGAEPLLASVAGEKKHPPMPSFFERIIALDVGGNNTAGDTICLTLLKRLAFYVTYQWSIILTSFFLPCGSEDRYVPRVAEQFKQRSVRVGCESQEIRGEDTPVVLPAVKSILKKSEDTNGRDSNEAARKGLRRNLSATFHDNVINSAKKEKNGVGSDSRCFLPFSQSDLKCPRFTRLCHSLSRLKKIATSTVATVRRNYEMRCEGALNKSRRVCIPAAYLRIPTPIVRFVFFFVSLARRFFIFRYFVLLTWVFPFKLMHECASLLLAGLFGVNVVLGGEGRKIITRLPFTSRARSFSNDDTQKSNHHADGIFLLKIPAVLTSSYIQEVFANAIGGRPLYRDVEGSGLIVRPHWRMAWPYVRTYLIVAFGGRASDSHSSATSKQKAVTCFVCNESRELNGGRVGGLLPIESMRYQETLRPITAPTLFVCGPPSRTVVKFHAEAWLREVVEGNARFARQRKSRRFDTEPSSACDLPKHLSSATDRDLAQGGKVRVAKGSCDDGDARQRSNYTGGDTAEDKWIVRTKIGHWAFAVGGGGRQQTVSNNHETNKREERKENEIEKGTACGEEDEGNPHAGRILLLRSDLVSPRPASDRAIKEARRVVGRIVDFITSERD